MANILRRRGRASGHYRAEREWLESYHRWRASLDIAIRAAEAEQDRAVRITQVLDGIGGGRSSGISDKVGTGVANYDELLPYLRRNVARYALELAERMQAVDAVTRPESRDVLWRQYIIGETVNDVAAYFGVTRNTVSRWGVMGLEEIHENFEREGKKLPEA